MELAGYFTILRRWWWTVLMATWIAGLAGYVFASGMTPGYEARARILVGPVTADLNTLRAAAGLLPTFAEIAQSKPLLERVAEELGIEEAYISERLAVTGNDTTRMLTIRYDDSDADRVAAVPNAIGEELVGLQPAGSTLPEGELSVIEPASVPIEPSSPDIPLLAALAAGTGFVGALILVMLLEYLNHSIKDPSELDQLVDVPVLATVRPPSARVHRSMSSPLFVDAMPASTAATALRTAAIKAVYRSDAKPARSLLVVAVDDAGGSGEIAGNIAAAISLSGQRVTLVNAGDAHADADVIMAAVDLPGVAELVAQPVEAIDRAAIDAYVLPRWAGVDVIPRGHGDLRAINPSAVKRLLERLKPRNDLTVVLAPPVQHGGTALVWARRCDAVVLLVRRDTTTREALVDAVASLRLVGAAPAGIIVYERPSSLALGRGGAPRWQGMAQAFPAPLDPKVRPSSEGGSASGSKTSARRSAPTDGSATAADPPG